MDINLEDNGPSRSLEQEGTSKEEVQEASSPRMELSKDWHYKKDHPKDLIMGDTSKGVTTRSQLKPIINLAFISQIEPKNIDDALSDEF